MIISANTDFHLLLRNKFIIKTLKLYLNDTDSLNIKDFNGLILFSKYVILNILFDLVAPIIDYMTDRSVYRILPSMLV